MSTNRTSKYGLKYKLTTTKQRSSWWRMESAAVLPVAGQNSSNIWKDI
jgi:hypothetical protein